MPRPRKTCPTCKKRAHNFAKEDAPTCVPPKNALVFGGVEIDPEYREELYAEYPEYTAEQIVATWQGENPDFPGEEDFFASQSGSESDAESGSTGSYSDSDSASTSGGSESWDD